MARVFKMLDLATQSLPLALLIYEDVLIELRDQHQIATTQTVRDAVADALISVIRAGQRNTFQLKRYGIACGIECGRKEMTGTLMMKPHQSHWWESKPAQTLILSNWREILGFDDQHSHVQSGL